MLDPKLLAPERIRPLLRREYERLVELGVFADERVELLRGQLVEMSPQGAPHATITAVIHELLTRALDESFTVRAHSPFAAADDSEPEPDVSVSRKLKNRTYYHPRKALLLIEVAESSLRKDRDVKADIYAENGAPEYWIVDVRAKRVHVYTQPRGGVYTQLVEVPRTGTLRPTQLPGVKLSVAKIFGLR